VRCINFKDKISKRWGLVMTAILNKLTSFIKRKKHSQNPLKVNAINFESIDINRPLVTKEIHAPNDFYGHATILKQYAKVQSDYQIKAAIEHGPFFGGFSWDVDINAKLPAILVPAAYRYPILNKITNKVLFAIGPMLGYANHYLQPEVLLKEKRRLGKNLLVFPAHSSHHVDINYDVDGYCQFLENLGKEFQSVQICMYWKDILRGIHKKYEQYGFECVTAGHIFDPLFLPKLKSIIELATVTTSNAFGTHIGYSIMMEKPHYLTNENLQKTAETKEILNRDAPDRTHKPDLLEIKNAFSELRSDISGNQMEIVQKYWGSDQIKSVYEMKILLNTLEDMYICNS
jgi:hypothetical protein